MFGKSPDVTAALRLTGRMTEQKNVRAWEGSEA